MGSFGNRSNIERFTMIELGAGYRRSVVRAALTVKRYHGGLPIKLIEQAIDAVDGRVHGE
jgi:hypothetical protein